MKMYDDNHYKVNPKQHYSTATSHAI